VEFRILAKSCVNCYYYGKVCFMGMGKVSPLFFKRGPLQGFSDRRITWADILPDFLVSIIPLFGGALLLLISFSWLILISMIAILFLMTVGNSVVRGSLACKYCKQREIGCPAQKLFEKRNARHAGKGGRGGER